MVNGFLLFLGVLGNAYHTYGYAPPVGPQVDFHEAEIGDRCHVPGSGVMNSLLRFAAQGFFVAFIP